jgi:hypothetical protein
VVALFVAFAGKLSTARPLFGADSAQALTFDQLSSASLAPAATNHRPVLTNSLLTFRRFVLKLKRFNFKFK